MNIEGRNPVLELLRSDRPIERLYIQHRLHQDTKINAIVKKAKKKDAKITRKTKKELDRMSETKAHQGVIAISKHVNNITLNQFVEERLVSGEPLQILYIREAFHEFNIGAIIRTAECAGFDAVVLPPKINITSQIVRASMGASEHIMIFSSALFPLMKNLKKKNIKVVGIERTEESVLHTDADLKEDIMLIIGGEDRELSEQITKKCDQVVQIPMKGKVNSLNMSVAAAIVIYETMRQNETENSSK